jgi:hypothetical protein
VSRPPIRIWPAVDQICAMGLEAALPTAGVYPDRLAGLLGFDVNRGVDLSFAGRNC